MYERRTMMKKLLVLSLVLGIASLATAGFSLSTDNVEVVLSGADNPAEPVTLFQVFADLDSVGDPVSSFGGDPVAPADAMFNAGNFEALLGLDPGSVVAAWMLEIKDTAEPFVAPNGDLVTNAVSGVGTAYVLNQQGVLLDSVDIVPEPATLALLGLGALVLRRKK
jgi:hypothetical protein